MNKKSKDIFGKSYNKGFMLSLILLATFSGFLMQTSLGTAMPILMKDFNIDLSTAQQATTWFLLANGMMVPLAAYLSTRFPTRMLHIVAYTLLLIGVLISALTPANEANWICFVIGRIIAAIAVGIMLPMMQIIILAMFSKEKIALAMGFSGLVIGMAPAIGPTLSGYILNSDHQILGITISNSWRSVFILPIVVITIVLILSPFFIKDIIPNKSIKLDIKSLFLSISGLGIFLWGFTNISSNEGHSISKIILPIIIGSICLVLFVLRQLKLKIPFLDIRVFKVRSFTVATILLILVTMAMYGVEMILPVYLQSIHNTSPFFSGLILLPGALSIGLMSPISGFVYNKFGIKKLSFIAFLLLTIGTIPFIFLTKDTLEIFITTFYTLRMIGVGLVMMPLVTYAMSSLPIEMTTHGTAVNNTVRQISSSVVVAFLTSITENVTKANQPQINLLLTNKQQYIDATAQASMIGFRASFVVSLMFAIVGMCIVFLLKKNQ